MKTVNVSEMRNVEGGASKYVYCPYCDYKYKTSLFQRLFWSNKKVEGWLYAEHGLMKNVNKGWEYARSSAVHK